MNSVAYADFTPTNHILTSSPSDMVVALEPSYYLTAGDVDNVAKNSRHFDITNTETSYHDLFLSSGYLPDDEVFEPTLEDMNGLRYHPIRMYSSTSSGRSIELNRILDRLDRYRSLGAHDNILRIDSLYTREHQPLALVSSRRLIPLRDYIESDPKADRRKICLDLAKGVDFLHSNGFSHGRIRLSNMFVCAETGACMLGMPSERSLPNGITLREYSRWAAPELAHADFFRRLPVDHYRDTYRGEYRADSDIYALACTIVEIYTGNAPEAVRLNYNKPLAGTAFRSDAVGAARIPPDVMHTLGLMMNLDPGRRLNSGLVVEHLANPRLAHVTKFQPALARYQARRFMRSMSARSPHL